MNTVTRREFLAASAAVLLASRLRAQPAPAAIYTWTEVAKGVFVAQNRTASMAVVGGNSILLPHADGSLLIDTKQAVLGASLKREASAHAPVKHVINTHHHFDHAGGNWAFSQDAALHAHPACITRLADAGKQYAPGVTRTISALEAAAQDKSIPDADALLADAKAFRDSLATLKDTAWQPTQELKPAPDAPTTLTLAGAKIEVHHFGPGHTDNDLALFLPASNVLVTGDLLFHALHAYFDASAKASSTGWTAACERLLKLCNDKTVVVPGHGAVGDKQIITKQIEYFRAATKVVEDAIKDGKTRDEVAKLTIPNTESHGLKIAEALVLGGIYDEHKK